MALDIADDPVHTQPQNDAMLEMNYANGNIKVGPYPERPGVQDCAYYLKTGDCGFGMTCRFNHPTDIGLDIYGSRFEGDFPERIGEPECQYYLKTGTCKFGAICKFHHPKDKVEIDGTVSLNILGYPIRTNERECSYYLRTGVCKFGSMCKFHHPHLSSMPTLHSSPAYSSVKSSTTTSQQASNFEGDTKYDISRAYLTANPSWQGLPSYSPQFVLPSGVVSVSSWNAAYAQAQPGSFPTSQNQRQTSCLGMFGWQKDNIYPERPDEPLCQFYIKTGDCKFGAICKFHHPKDRSILVPNCLLSPLGLPLRPGQPPCSFYSRYGICKFGPNCKFDHPMGTFTYGLPLSSLSDVPIVRRMLCSLPGTSALEMSIPRDKTIRLSTQMFSKDEETFDDDSSQ